MGTITRGILGGFAGKVANVVGSSWKGIAVIKSLPLSVANPRSAGQVNQRTKFAAVVLVAKQLLGSIVKPMWDRFAQKESGYNAFVSANINAFNDAGEIYPPSLKTSVGSLLGIDTPVITLNATAQVLSGTFIDNSGEGNALGTDTLCVALITPDNNKAVGWELTTTRSNGSFGLLPVEGIFAGDVYAVYLSFKRADGSLVSNSMYVSVTATA